MASTLTEEREAKDYLNRCPRPAAPRACASTYPCAPESEAARGQTEKDPLAPAPKLLVEGKCVCVFIVPEERFSRGCLCLGVGDGGLWMFPLRGQVGWRREPSSQQVSPNPSD